MIATQYDDGGYTGANMDRPALKRLLEDVGRGQIEVIVVYKVDRLTRSLADFAKIIEALDVKAVSFVSVTQQFNTTCSMGRLTLNVLLSFAQFEREVTGERIRDKIAASKRKGIWMGGLVPLGYRLEGRKLLPDPEEAKVVNRIYRLYLELGCVAKLRQRLEEEGTRSKSWVTRDGNRIGGKRFSRGALYAILRNRLYRGDIRHKDTWYPGLHDGIVAADLWEKVKTQLARHINGQRRGLNGKSPSLLTGLLEDQHGIRYTPFHVMKKKKRYRYYVSQARIQADPDQRIERARVPAEDTERCVIDRLHSFLGSKNDIMNELASLDDRVVTIQGLMRGAERLVGRWKSMQPSEVRVLLSSIVHRVILHDDSIELVVHRRKLREMILGREVAPGEDAVPKPVHPDPEGLIRLRVDAELKRCGLGMRLVVPPCNGIEARNRVEPALVKAVVRSHEWYQWMLDGVVNGPASISRRTGLTKTYVSRVFRCARLAPDIVDAILDGRQPPTSPS